MKAAGSKAPSSRRPRPLHRSGLIALIVGALVSAGLALGTHLSIATSQRRFLRSQLHQTASALATSVISLQDPLIAAAGLGSSIGTDTFRRYVRSLVGPADPFHSVSLWSVHGTTATLVADVGAPPSLPQSAGPAGPFLQRLRVSPILQVLSATPRPTGTDLTVAERDPGSPGHVVVAEATLPSARALAAAGSAFAGLHFVALIHLARGPAERLEGTASGPPPSAPTAQGATTFGTGRVDLLEWTVGPAPGALPAPLPAELFFVGLALTLGATASLELQARRRRRAEDRASEHDRRYEEQRAISERLQHTIRPQEPSRHEGVELAARYVPGTSNLGVGGDWYDTISLDDGSLVLALGDVSGHGLGAASLVPALRHSLRAYALQGDAPSDILRKLNEVIDVERDHCMSTALCAKLDVRGRSVEVALAGHPPPIIVHRGTAALARAKVGTPLGVAKPVLAPSTSWYLPEGASMLFYSDGLVEHRRRPIDAGLEELRHRAELAAGSIQQVVDALVQHLAPGGAADDVAILGLRLIASTSPVGEPGTDVGNDGAAGVGDASATFPPLPGSPRAARNFVAQQLRGHEEFDATVALLLVSELASNAVVHASTDFTVAVRIEGDRLHVEVTDTGAVTSTLAPSRARAVGGRGLQLVNELADRWGVDRATDGARKSVWFELAPPAAAAPAYERQLGAPGGIT